MKKFGIRLILVSPKFDKMNRKNLQHLLNLAILTSVKAGEKILEIYNSENFDIEIKSDNTPLTNADKASHKIISSALSKSKIPMLSEEGKKIDYEERKKWSKLWIVDPIDGTKEFIKRNGEFTVNIALIENQTPILGVIYAPVTNELYFSTKTIGSYKAVINHNDFKIHNLISKSVKLPVNRKDKIFTVVASRSHNSNETGLYIEEMRLKHGEVNIVNKGSSLKLCMVAEGKADCYPRFAPTMEWDTAAGQAICEHAGFSVIDWKTKKNLIYNRENLLNNWFLVF